MPKVRDEEFDQKGKLIRFTEREVEDIPEPVEALRARRRAVKQLLDAKDIPPWGKELIRYVVAMTARANEPVDDGPS